VTYRLFDFGPSPFCIKVRAVLDFKGQRFERLDINGPAYVKLLLKNPTRKVPALEIDGTLVADSTDICHALDARHPEPPLLPDDAKSRALCHVIEDWADESLYFFGLYYRWQEPRGRREAGSLFPAVLRPALVPAVGGSARKQLHAQGLGRKSPEHVQRDLRRHLDAAVDLLSGEWLLGDRPRLCDFALASQLLYLFRTPLGGELVGEHARLTRYLEQLRELRGVRPQRASA
jgi:glutathione S-transferase